MRALWFPQMAALLALSICLTSETTGPRTRCKDGERAALLKFKDGLYFRKLYRDGRLLAYDPSGEQDAGIILSNWGEEEAKRECCEWIGIRCDNETGRVVALDLSPESAGLTELMLLGGNNISSSLDELTELSYLDLSRVFLLEITIPSFVGNFAGLRYLNLSYTSLSGEVPAQLGNLSNLQVLDLSHSELDIGSLSWASRLSSLRLLHLGYTNMGDARDWVRVVNNLPSLTNLALPNCKLRDAPNFSLANRSSKGLTYLDLSWNFEVANSTFTWLLTHSRSLVHLDISWCRFELSPSHDFFADMGSVSYLSLSGNFVEGSISESFGNLTSLTRLGLAGNHFKGSVPESFGNLTSLEHIDLSTNMLQGEIPKSIWEIHTLKYFDVSKNNISGDISESIGKLSNLETLDLSENSIEAAMSETHFAKLSSLSHLDLSSNKDIVLDISSGWIPPFQLEYINLGSCKLGPRFPRWLERQKRYTVLNMSHSEISDSIPNWLWNRSDGLRILDLSNNQLKGTIPDINPNFTYQMIQIDLSSNRLEGPVPVFLLRIYALSLYQNRFSDISSICNVSMVTPLVFLDISGNKITGELPSCWSNMKNMQILILGNNRFIGDIPDSIGDMPLIETLQLTNNEFSGKLPASIKNCTQLMVFNVGGNKLTGEIPTWIGASLGKLVVLSLRSNSFIGSLKRELCKLDELQVLDFSSNNLSGKIPSCFGNFTTMRDSTGYGGQIVQYFKDGFPSLQIYNEKLTAQWKGSVAEFQNLGLLKNLDLSSNKLRGEIPEELTLLIGLISLNLSRNNLSGRIPNGIGQMQWLDALDLSRNHLSGKIPSSLSKIDRLGILDLSSNNLSGKIPTGTQLQNRDASAYLENPKLCGVPLPRKCPGEEDQNPTNSKPDGNSHEDQDWDDIVTTGFYISIATGFFVGFCGILAFIKR